MSCAIGLLIPQGPVSPAMQEILNKWAPVSDKAKLVSYSWAGRPIVSAIC